MTNTKDLLQGFNEFDFFDNVDLHIHSTFSDGKLTPQEIIRLAKEKGLTKIAICDHNTVEAYRTEDISKEKILLTGVEFDCWYKGVLIHILGYGIDIDNKELLSLCAKDKAGTTSDVVRFFSYRHPKKVIQAIHSAGGIAILAHPACYWVVSLENYIKNLVKLGLDGVEVYYPYKRHRGIIKFHLANAVKRIAKKHNLIETGGSDTHGSTI